jgi:3alpha(or 20beta)-hydroxysteroid dehydrogenase
MDLTGKTVVVTGAGRGQGATETELFASLGASVVAIDREFEEEPRSAVASVVVDVSSPDDWKRLGKILDRDFREVHGLVNNAGIPGRSRVLEVTQEEWNRVLGVNVTGALLGIQAVAPFMRSGASIVNISSVAGLFGIPSAAYCASKWAVRGLSLAASHELGPRGIRVNTIIPGYIDTPLIRQNPRTMYDMTLELIPLGRTGETTDVAPMIAFLLSDQASWISGAEIPVDGGQHVHGGMKATFEALAKLPAAAH